MNITNTSSLVWETKLFIEISSKRKFFTQGVEDWNGRVLSGMKWNERKEPKSSVKAVFLCIFAQVSTESRSILKRQ